MVSKFTGGPSIGVGEITQEKNHNKSVEGGKSRERSEAKREAQGDHSSRRFGSTM